MIWKSYEDVLKKMRHNIRMDIRNIRKEYLQTAEGIRRSSRRKKTYESQRCSKDCKKEKIHCKEERHLK